MTGVGFEPTPPKRLVPKTSALDHSANQSLTMLKEFGFLKILLKNNPTRPTHFNSVNATVE